MKTFSFLLPLTMPEILIHKAFFHTPTKYVGLTKRLVPFCNIPGPVDLPGIGSFLNILWNGGLQNQHEIMVSMFALIPNSTSAVTKI